ncbi:MAG: tyrosine-type recombinase/integrase [Bacteriovoracales bacterium]|nr:tyrosine-type recombinase/integrase [Bacteriovoracales bacterium]
MSKQRFLPLKNHEGIRKDTLTGRYVARKRIGKKQYAKTFSKIADAVHWKRHFHPLLTNTELRAETSKKKRRGQGLITVQSRPNGVDQRFTLEEVWELYRKFHFPTIEQQTIYHLEKFAENFFSELMHLKMQEINPEVLDVFMEKKVANVKKNNNRRRHNFDKDLKSLKALLNWYRENYDGMFTVPILKRHFSIGTIKKIVKRNVEKMSVEQVKLFLRSLDEEFWRDFAQLHFFMAGRVQEVGGLQWSSIDFQRGFLKVQDVSVWSYFDRNFTELKEVPKNHEQRIVPMNGPMTNVLKRRWENRSKTPCRFQRQSTGEALDFVFHIDGQPLNYRSIQYQYNKALKKAGLYPKFRSTHILRKAMANIVRQELGLDAAQAAGGWKTREIVEKTYTDAPNQLAEKAVFHVEKLVTGESGGPFSSDPTTVKQKHLKLLLNR